MSASTRSSAAEVRVRGRAPAPRIAFGPILGLAIVLTVAAPAVARAVDAPPLPPRVVELVPGLTVQGGGELRFFGVSVCDGYYWSATGGWLPDQPFALDLHYRRALDGERIAERSSSEIARLGYGTPEQRARWGQAMKRLFPDVRSGDSLTGVNLPGGGVRYFHNGTPIGEIAEPGFARAFFGIWLDPRTSQLDFRQLLLGEKR